jgi:septin 3/9/12
LNKARNLLSTNIQIMAEMQHNQIRSYPFDAEENDEEELQLNERIRVSYLGERHGIELISRRCYPSLLLVRNEVSSSMASRSGAERTDGESSMSKMNDIVNLSTSETSSPGKLAPSNHQAKLIIRTHLQDLIETTAQIHYETFRAKQLLALKESSGKAAAQAAQAAA